MGKRPAYPKWQKKRSEGLKLAVQVATIFGE